MKKAVFLLALLGLTILSCKKMNSANSSGSLDGNWRMISVKDNTSGLLTFKPASIQGDVDITFSPQSSSGGVIFGNTPTNEIGQSAYSIDANGSITIPALYLTSKVMETPWGKEFVDNIINSRQYSFENSNLIIKTSTKTLTFQKR